MLNEGPLEGSLLGEGNDHNAYGAVIIALCGHSMLIQKVAPPLSHLHALVPIIAAIVDASDRIAVAMGQRPLDGIWMPQAAFVEHRGCR